MKQFHCAGSGLEITQGSALGFRQTLAKMIFILLTFMARTREATWEELRRRRK